MLQEFEGLVDVQLSDMEKVIHSHREQDGDYIRVGNKHDNSVILRQSR